MYVFWLVLFQARSKTKNRRTTLPSPPLLTKKQRSLETFLQYTRPPSLRLAGWDAEVQHIIASPQNATMLLIIMQKNIYFLV